MPEQNQLLDLSISICQYRSTPQLCTSIKTQTPSRLAGDVKGKGLK